MTNLIDRPAQNVAPVKDLKQICIIVNCSRTAVVFSLRRAMMQLVAWMLWFWSHATTGTR